MAVTRDLGLDPVEVRRRNLLTAEETRRLAEGLYEFVTAGALSLKGFAEPQVTWQVLRPRTVESRFSARHAERLTPLVGRDEELGATLVVRSS